MKGILMPVYIESIQTRKDKSIKIILGSQEISAGKAGELFTLLNNVAICYISPKEINQREIDQVDKLEADIGGKTQSQRIRNVLFKLFEQDNEGYQHFDEYYRAKTEKYIDHLKSKIA